jgi:regulator of RNase E activity RraA
MSGEMSDTPRDRRSEMPSVTAIADVLALWGVDGALTPPLSPLVAPAEPAIGRARTLQIEPTSGESRLGDVYDLLSRDLTGCVVVVAGAYSVGGAMWGKLLSTAAVGRHAAGALVDGGVRDVPTIEQLGLPLYARGVSALGTALHAQVTGVDDAVCIEGVDVIADDLIAIDSAGCVRIPQAIEAEVLEAARRYAAAEDEVLRMLAEGLPLTRAYMAKRSVVNELRKER